MEKHSATAGFRPFMFILFLLPYWALELFVKPREMEDALVVAVLAVTALCLLVHIARNFQEIIAGLVVGLLLFAALAACAFIPVVGWIFDVLMVIYALASTVAALAILVPLAVRAALMWAIFIACLVPAWHHPVLSPVGYAVFALVATTALSKKDDPYGELTLLISSVPLVLLIIATLGRLFQTTIGSARIGVAQQVSGYTTKSGVHVAAYTRTVAKTVTTVSTTVSASAVATNAATAASAASQEDKNEPGK